MRTAGLYYSLGWPAPAASSVISRVISRLVSATITLLGDGSAASSRERTEDEEEWTDSKGNVTKKIKVHKGKGDKDHKIIIKKIDGDDDLDGEMRIIEKKIIKSGDGEMVIHEGHGDSDEKHIEVLKSKSGKGKNVFIIKDSDDDEDIEVMEGDGFFFVDSESGEKPLYIVDGKVVKEKVIKSLSPKDIATVNVYKGDKAIEKYGKKANNLNKSKEGSR